MKEINYILSNRSAKSLVIIDELGRGTSVEEGVSLCWAICEELLQDNGLFTLFATHFLELCQLRELYPNVSCSHFEVTYSAYDGGKTDMIFNHTMADGPTEEQFYGLKMAHKYMANKEIVQSAYSIARELDGSSSILRVDRQEERELIDANEYKLVSVLKQIKNNKSLEGDALKSYVKFLRREFLAASTDGSCSMSGDGDSSSNTLFDDSSSDE